MSTNNSKEKKDPQPRKKRKTKRKANSPLNDNVQCSANSSRTDNRSDVNKQVSTGQPYNFNDPYVQSPIMNFTQQVPFSMQQPQTVGAPMQNQGTPAPTQIQSTNQYMTQTQSPTQVMSSQPMYIPPPVMAPTGPPNWAQELINDVKQIKISMSKLEKIEKTMNTIVTKVSDLESKVKDIDKSVNDVEGACSFISKENDDRKKELQTAKSEISKLKEKCEYMEKSTSDYAQQSAKMESKVSELESRSMRDNLMFYGITEMQNEDCEQLIKQFCIEKLEVPEAQNLTFDRVHRVGYQKANKTRPIVAKFHYYKEREVIRTKSFEKSEQLKQQNLRVGAQWPQQVRDARKTLYPIMLREKQKGNNVKFVRDKLFVNGQEYALAQDEQQPPLPARR